MSKTQIDPPHESGGEEFAAPARGPTASPTYESAAATTRRQNFGGSVCMSTQFVSRAISPDKGQCRPPLPTEEFPAKPSRSAEGWCPAPPSPVTEVLLVSAMGEAGRLLQIRWL